MGRGWERQRLSSLSLRATPDTQSKPQMQGLSHSGLGHMGHRWGPVLASVSYAAAQVASSHTRF